MSEEFKAPLRMRTPEFVVSYATVFEPKLNKLNKQMEYSLDALFDKKTNDMKQFKAMIKTAVEEMWPDPKHRPKKLRLDAIKDGDEKENDPIYNGHWYLKLKSRTKPLVVGTKRNPDGSFIEMTSEDDFYSGCIARAMVTCSAYSHEEISHGVAFYLGNIQKIKDGENLGCGHSDPVKDFGDDTPEEEVDPLAEFGF